MSSADNQQAAVDDLVSVQQQLFNLDEDGNDSNDAGIPPFPADGWEDPQAQAQRNDASTADAAAADE